jgi:tetratricopeptide (TPR) repeat protein
LLALGNAYLAAEKYPEAIKQYQELLEHEPEMEAARPQLAKALRLEGRTAEADQGHTEP